MAFTTSRELSFVRLGNPAIARDMQVQAFLFDQKNNKTLEKQIAIVNVPSQNALHVQIQNWDTLDASLQLLQAK